LKIITPINGWVESGGVALITEIFRLTTEEKEMIFIKECKFCNLLNQFSVGSHGIGITGFERSFANELADLFSGSTFNSSHWIACLYLDDHFWVDLSPRRAAQRLALAATGRDWTNA
jgi:hypothetical protein